MTKRRMASVRECSVAETCLLGCGIAMAKLAGQSVDILLSSPGKQVALA